MPDYKSMYFTLFNAITTALDLLYDNSICSAAQTLMEAQLAALSDEAEGRSRDKP